MIELVVNAQTYTNFENIEVKSSLTTLARSFVFRAYSNAKQAFPFSVNDPCQVKIDGALVLTGFVDVTEASYSHKSHAILISGRSKTSDVVDSSLGDDIEFKGSQSLKSLIEATLAQAKITGISVIDTVGDIPDFAETELESPSTGTTVFAFIERFCRKRQVLVTTNGAGSIVIARGQTKQERFTLLNTFATPDTNNILSGSVTFDASKRFRKYFVRSGGNPAAGGGGLILGPEDDAGAVNKAVVNSEGEAEDRGDLSTPRGLVIVPVVRTSRQMYIVSETASTNDICRLRAIWQANMNRVKSFKYKVTVQGFTNELTGNVWEPNFLVKVNDVFANVKGQLLIESVTYKVSTTGGSTTELTLVIPDAYKVLAEEPLGVKKSTSLVLGPRTGPGT